MTDKKFQVLSESSPIRCDICHQTDMFDPLTATCLRCQAIVISQPQSTEAHQYREWQLTIPSQNSLLTFPSQNNLSLPIRELFQVMGEAVRLYWRNLAHLIVLVAIVEIPIRTATVLFLTGPSEHNFWALLSYYLVPFVFSSIITGAIIKSIFSRYQGEPASLLDSYRAVLRRPHQFLITSVLGNIYQYIGLIACYLGSLYTYPRGAFAAETALLEERYFMNGLRRSIELGRRNSGVLILVGICYWLTLGLGGPFIWNTITTPNIDQHIPLQYGQQLTSMLLSVLLLPIFRIINLLVYLHLRQRDGDSFNSTSSGTAEPGKTFRLRSS